MSIIDIMDSLPLWGIFIASVVIIILSLELGFLMGKRDRGRLSEGEKISTGLIIGASLSLLAFMLALAFGSVASRLNERKHLVIDEANAIGTTFLRSDLLPLADRAEVRRILHDYVSLRLKFMREDTTMQYADQEFIDRSKELQDELWDRAVAIADQKPTPITALFLQSVNEVIDMHEKRVVITVDHRMSAIVWITLFGLTIFAMLVAGYDAALKNRRRAIKSMLMVAIAFSFVLMLVAGLDRPRQHLSPVTQAALIDLQGDIRRSMQSQQ